VTFCNFVVARQYSIVKELDDFAAISTRRFFVRCLRRLLMSEFGGWLCAPGLAAGVARRVAPSYARRFRSGLRTEVLVGLDRLELSTSPLSGARSSHLSYRPVIGRGPVGQRPELVELVGIEPATS
jgi:hypothetical protein